LRTLVRAFFHVGDLLALPRIAPGVYQYLGPPFKNGTA
jgi:hypothetical protein